MNTFEKQIYDHSSVPTSFHYSELKNPENTLLAMLEGKVNSLPSHIQAVYVQNILKILNVILREASTKHAVEVIIKFTMNLGIVMSKLSNSIFSVVRNDL